MAERQGWLVAVDFGSVASEVAVCAARAGLADVSSTGKLEVRGTEAALAAVAGEDGSWWRVAPGLLLAITAPGAQHELEERIAGHPVKVADVTADRVALSLVGPAAGAVLERAGCEVAPVGAVRTESVHGVPTLTLRQDTRRWLLVAPAADAAELWH